MRPSRSADGGYYKATGREASIVLRGEEVAKKRSLVFYTGKPPKGEKTDWILHEYRLMHKRERKGLEDMRVRTSFQNFFF